MRATIPVDLTSVYLLNVSYARFSKEGARFRSDFRAAENTQFDAATNSSITSRMSRPTDVIKSALSKTSAIFKNAAGISQHTKIDNRYDVTRECVREWFICVHAGDICVLRAFVARWEEGEGGWPPCEIHRTKYRKRVTIFVVRARACVCAIRGRVFFAGAVKDN